MTKPLLSLMIEDTTVQTGTVAVSWCLDRSLLEILEKKGIKKPKLLLVTAPQGKGNYASDKESRKIVSLEDGMTFIDFRSAGANRIFAILVWADGNDLDEKFFTLDGGKWKTSVLHPTTGEKPTSGIGFRINTEDEQRVKSDVVSAYLDVEVPAECFAKEPAAWEKKWVNFMFDNPPRDQCAFRRRRIWAYTLQPFLVTLFWVCILCIGVIFYLGWLAAALIARYLIGMRGVDFDFFWNPLHGADDPGDVFNGVNGSVFMPSARKHGLKALLAIPFMPAILICLITLIWASTSAHSTEWLWSDLFILAGWLIGVFLVSVTALLCVVYATKRAIKYQEDNNPDFGKPKYLKGANVQFLTCDGSGAPRTFSTLPAGRRTIRLRKEHFKAKVCQPFSK